MTRDALQPTVVSGAITHPPDFAYSVESGEFGSRLQSLLLQKYASSRYAAEEDDDQDLVITEPGGDQPLVVLTEESVQFERHGLSSTGLDLPESALRRQAHLVDDVFRLRGVSRWENYQVGVFVAFHLTEACAAELLRTCWPASLESAVTQKGVSFEPLQVQLQLSVRDADRRRELSLAFPPDQRAVLAQVDLVLNYSTQAPSFEAFVLESVGTAADVIRDALRHVLEDPRVVRGI